ncbi:hypothetical protein QWZ13_05660 [Reinekea marina]|nr:hypothetical protein [Reinekea marina]MDN3648392.1 hypothetical protein [Reinekea marina]
MLRVWSTHFKQVASSLCFERSYFIDWWNWVALVGGFAAVGI